jgi:FHS family glucose/mannose:H+ symporter-like MFS transporter
MTTEPRMAAQQVPSVAMMHFSFILTGLGTAMLGPLLPSLTRQWHLLDQQSGLLLLAQFCGSFLGGATMSWRLKRGLLLGMGASTVGLLVFAVSPGLALACPALFVAGFGLGHSITAVNILAGQRFTEKRASALSLLNFFWSFGAMLAPLLAGWLTPHIALHRLLLAFASLFAICGVGLAFEMRGGFTDVRVMEQPHQQGGRSGLAGRTFLFFMGMLFLYGGLETCLSGWLTTYAFRYGDRVLAISQYTTLLLWMSLTFGRIGSAALLRRVPETLLWRLALLATTLLTGILATAHTAAGIAITTVLLGLSLSPWFPVTFSLLMGERPRARQAGIVIAVSGLGAASLPWMMGFLSTHSGSLQRALVIPLLAAMLLFGMSLLRRSPAATTV